jgi:hypothetical protein
LSSASAAHVLGQKQYELSSHLGNVQATVSDKRYVQKQYLSTTDSLRKGFAVAVRALYDYYPFGMPMKERSTSDTTTQSVYMSQVVYSPQYTKVNNAMSGASITSLNTTASTNYNGSVNYTGQSASISKVLSSLLPNVPVQMKIDLLYTNKPLYLAIQQGSAASPSVYTNLLYSTTMNSSGTYTISFTPTQSSVQLSIAYSSFNTNANTLCFTLDSVNYQQQSASVSSTQLVQVSNKLNDGYRFGFNGQEKVDEIAGAGNHTTAEFWEYDTRLGRRWNRDPKFFKYPGETPYSVMHNNPIKFNDPDGDDPPYRIKNGIMQGAGVVNDISSSTERPKMEVVRAVVIHRTVSSSARSAIRETKSSQGKTGFHIVVDNDGTITQLNNFQNRANHVGKQKGTVGNFNSIGVEVVGNYNANTKTWDPLTPEQVENTAQAVNTIMQANNLKLEDMYPHEDVSWKTPGEGKTVIDAMQKRLTELYNESKKAAPPTKDPGRDPNTENKTTD